MKEDNGCSCSIKMFLIFSLSSYFFISQTQNTATLTPSESLTDGQTLVSHGAAFELGFFSPSSNHRRYVGIWYKTIQLQTLVWVANRDSPLNDTSGVLKIGPTGGNIVLVLNTTQTVIWSSSSSSSIPKPVENPILEFLQSGNLVLRDGDSYLWQSFDYPGDTLLPGMKLGWDLNTGMKRYLSSWKSSEDPSHGDFTYGMDFQTGYLETAIKQQDNGIGSVKKIYRGGPWNGIRHSGAQDLKPNPIFTYQLVHNETQVYYMYQLENQSVIMRFVLTQTGHMQRLTWVDKTSSWVLLVSIPRDRCDDYALCGVYTTCDVNNVAVCQCLKGFSPKSPQDWSGTDWSQGCRRDTSLNCSGGDGFNRFTGVKLPDTNGSYVNESMNLEECKVKCLRNCSCMAYTNSDIRGGGSGCIMWFTDLIDIRQLNEAGQDLYIRMAAFELDSETNSRRKGNLKVIAIISCIIGIIIITLLGLGSWCIWKKRRMKGGSENDDLELPLYDLVTITSATNNFSNQNKLGEGGFGPVYKGKLEGDQEVAIKRLSKDSIQGVNEFKNEVILISKLQHRNLVRLLGCCIQGEEKMLIYEYMKNKSLDSFIFVSLNADKTKSKLLDWGKRFDIILGIARGLLYLHHDSRLKIIHRDLKASNVLLDSEMVPKISDFGMARLFGGDQNEAKTRRVVGTYGYMSPEYAMDGYFSVKSDVFSFGVLVLEIISGKKNRSFCHPDHEHNLLGHAWRLWNEHKSIGLVEESISESCYVEDCLRCIHVGLLCVQKAKEERPTMSSVVLMLSSESAVLANPRIPGFYIERSTPTTENSSINNKETSTSNEITLTWEEGR